MVGALCADVRAGREHALRWLASDRSLELAPLEFMQMNINGRFVAVRSTDWVRSESATPVRLIELLTYRVHWMSIGAAGP